MKKFTFVAMLLLAVMLVSAAFAGETVITYESRGVQVPATIVTPDGLESYPVVVMAHGHGGSREENVGFACVAAALQEKGIASIRMDFPGCGDSTEPFQMNTLENMEADVVAAALYMAENYPVTKLGLFGYSMGGRICLDLIAAGVDPSGVCLLAPAADVEDLKNLFGGAEAWETMKATAEADGFVVFTTIYGQVQNLSKEWFACIESNTHAAADAAALLTGDALVIWGTDDEAVSPSVSAMVAETLGAKTAEATGAGHGYGFYSEEDTVRVKVANAAADFFAEAFAPGYVETVVAIENGDHVIPGTLCVPVKHADANVPAVVMLHGTGSNREEAGNGYQMAAPVMAEEFGLVTLRIDFMGNGDSTADYTGYTFESAVSDAAAAADYLASLGYVGKIGVMGWSQGGTDALLAAGRTDKFSSVVTWAGAPDLSDMLGDENYAAAKENGYFVMEFDWRDSLNVSLQWCDDVANTDVLAVFSEGYQGPVLAIAGTEDTTVDPEWSNKIVAASSNELSATYFIEGMDHTFNVFSGDLSALGEAVGATSFYFVATLQ